MPKLLPSSMKLNATAMPPRCIDNRCCDVGGCGALRRYVLAVAMKRIGARAKHIFPTRLWLVPLLNSTSLHSQLQDLVSLGAYDAAGLSSPVHGVRSSFHLAENPGSCDAAIRDVDARCCQSEADFQAQEMNRTFARLAVHQMNAASWSAAAGACSAADGAKEADCTRCSMEGARSAAMSRSSCCSEDC